jgi:hypothetical protein
VKLTPWTDPDRLIDLKRMALAPEERALADALDNLETLGEKLLLIAGRYGIAGAAAYAKHIKRDRAQFRQAAADLGAVGLADLALLCKVVAPTKPKPWPNFYDRLKAKRRRLGTRAVPAKPLAELKPSDIKHIWRETT